MDINRFLVKTLNIKQDETKKFILLFFHSFFVGLFIAFYFVQANSVFVSNFESEWLPIAYLVAGAVGYLISWLYSYFQKKVKSKYLFASALIFMFLITLSSRIAYGFVSAEYEKFLSFFVFIWAWPFISLVGIESGGLALKLLNLIQVKRMFGLVNMGGVSASIIGYLIIPILSKVIGTSYNLLIFAAGSLVAAIFLVFFIYKNFPEEKTRTKQSKEDPKTGFKHLFKEKYFRLIFLSATLSMTVIYITDFGFLSSVKSQKELFPTAAKIASFFALVFAGLKVGELLISYLSSSILSRYGVKLGLTILPITLTLIVIASLVTGFTIGALSIVFLSLMVLNKSMERILRRGLDDPAFNILYQPLPQSQQLAVQAKVGIVMQFAIAIAGGLLFLLNFILKQGSGFKLEFFPLFFLPILIIWVIVAWRLYFAYKEKLREILKELSKNKERETSKYLYGSEVLTKKFKMLNNNVVNLSVTILSETNPRIFEPFVSGLLKKDDFLIQKAILKSIDPTWRTRILKQIKQIHETTKDVEVENLAERAIHMLDFTGIKEIKEEDIEILINSEEQNDKVKLIKFVTKNTTAKKNEEIILNLLKFNDRSVKNAAIRLSVSYKTEKIIKALIVLLSSSQYYHMSMGALLDMGEKTIPYLSKLFEESEDREMLLKIIEVYAKMGSSAAKSMLVKRINYPDRKVQLAVIWALYYCKYQAPEDEQQIIKDKIIQVTSNFLWITSCIRDVENEKNTLKLFLALDQEKMNNDELLFNLLSFLHDPRVINLIKKNIIGKNTIYAIELIDNFVMPDLKPYIVPVFDDIPDNSRIKKLSKYFPQKQYTFKTRLPAIIKQNYSIHDTWTIAKTIEMIDKIHRSKNKLEITDKEAINYRDIELWTEENTEPVLKLIMRSDLPDEVFLCLFHTDELVYSTAAKIIYEENPRKCIDYLQNMSEAKTDLVKVLEGKGFLLIDKVKLLRRYQLFFHVPDYLLVQLAKIIKPVDLLKGEKVFFNDENTENILILIRGKLSYKEGEENEQIFSKKIILTPGINIEQEAGYLVAQTKSTLISIERYQYFNLLIDNTEIIQHIFEAIQNKIRYA